MKSSMSTKAKPCPLYNSDVSEHQFPHIQINVVKIIPGND